MVKESICALVQEQRNYFHEGHTLPVSARIAALKQLRQEIVKNEEKICTALKADLGKSASESYMCEVGMVLSEIRYMQKHLRSFAREKTVRTPLAQFHSRSYKKPSPYGVTLIMSPWNYPFLLSLDPLIDAIAAGNTAIVKPSAYSPNTSAVIAELIGACLDHRLASVVTGGRTENACLLNEHFDYIFFTGSQTVGKEVMCAASRHLTPVTLELGGKSPCLVEKSANLKLAAKRIVFGKFLNCGQTCVAPDYVLCDQTIKDRLIAEIKRQIAAQYGADPLENDCYGKIINRKHFNRIRNLIDSDKIAVGGRCKEDTLQIEPTVLDNVTLKDAVMQEEIFGPVLPVLSYDNPDTALATVNAMPHPLAFYLFTSDSGIVQKFTSRCGFGGGCINDTIIHLATSQMGFGGFGESGMGSYHGKDGFQTFSHYKSIVDKKTWLDLPMRYQPYNSFYDKLIRFFLK